MSETDDKLTFKVLIDPARDQEPDAGYRAWKERKIRAALKQADQGGQMIPADKVWASFGFED
ncbi:hypothetical protein BJF93_16320 [Xaviernesmea oryzae]|uniref:Uncharacterized protein n=1 Tax=Xaviernesmea oryzae TaxID=464029 RepID=A0A1Q9ASN4_9HYPH|nr:hypothetical protein [Xaviernesmea oryzae]OLP58442.1 hypothetical protein BJF93_16320 [Xaviernesmea oryzae]